MEGSAQSGEKFRGRELEKISLKDQECASQLLQDFRGRERVGTFAS